MKRYLVTNDQSAADPVSLRDLAVALALHPAVEVLALTQLQGPALLLVASMPEEVAEQLRAAFAGRLLVEEDAPLQAFSQ